MLRSIIEEVLLFVLPFCVFAGYLIVKRRNPFDVEHWSRHLFWLSIVGLSLAIEFDCYLIDEVVAVGDARFQQKCREELFERRAHKAFIMASHDTHLVTEQCDRAIIIEGDKAKVFEDIGEATEVYTWLRAA